MEQPRTIHDFGGFPKALYEVQYPSPGSPGLVDEVKSLITVTSVGSDHKWGLDHEKVINYHSQGRPFEMAIPTTEHYLPLLYALALKELNEEVQLFNDKAVAGSLTMTSVKIG